MWLGSVCSPAAPFLCWSVPLQVLWTRCQGSIGVCRKLVGWSKTKSKPKKKEMGERYPSSAVPKPQKLRGMGWEMGGGWHVRALPAPVHEMSPTVLSPNCCPHHCCWGGKAFDSHWPSLIGNRGCALRKKCVVPNYLCS